MDDGDIWDDGFDFSAMDCHVEGCREPATTNWRSCYADTALCERHHEVIDMIELEEIELSCCWYPFAASWQAVA